MFIEVFRFEDYNNFATQILGGKSIAIEGINYGEIANDPESFFENAQHINMRVFKENGYEEYNISDFKVLPLNESAKENINQVNDQWLSFMVDNFGSEFANIYNKQFVPKEKNDFML